MQFARRFFRLEKRPCNLRGGFLMSKNVLSICGRAFQPSKASLQFDWALFDGEAASSIMLG